MAFLLLAAGATLLLFGGEWLVRGAVKVAERLGMSPMLIGVTLIGFGTSMPELVTSVEAALIEAPGIAIGNVVGSNIANILLILGFTALVATVPVTSIVIRRDGTAMTIATIATAGILLTGHIGRLTGSLLLLALIAYLTYSVFADRRLTAANGGAPADTPAGSRDIALPLLLALAGLSLTILGARLFVEGAVLTAEALGMSQGVIGLTVVAVGTSLPELVTAGIAALKRQTDLALGNVIGSNIFNLFGILGITALVHPVDVPGEIAGPGLYVLLGATALLLAFGLSANRIARWEGAVLLAGYAGYTLFLILVR